MANYYLGLDGGGTKTTAEIAGENGKILCRVIGDSINYYSEGLEQARTNFSAILTQIKGETKINHIDSIFIGMSALYGRASDEELFAFTKGICDTEHTTMDSDLFIALEALMREGECGVVISGTGSMAAARRQNGEIICRGGYGYILGDEGSGYKIGLEGIQKAIMAFDNVTDKTTLTDTLLKKFGVSDAHDLIDIFYDPPIERKIIADFARDVSYCAQNGDKTAVEIVINEAQKLARTTASLLKEFSTAIPLGVYGGIFMNNPIFFKSFNDELAQIFPGAQAEKLPVEPVRGAILAAMRENGVKITDEIKKNIMEE